MSTELAPSADQNTRSRHDGFSFEALVQAYFDCRRTKRNSPTSLAFEANLEHNLRTLYRELINGTYTPGQSICFVVTRPKPREVWAADFRDRIVHHLLYNHIGPRIEATFIADSCACIKGRGTLYAAQRLEQKARSITQNWQRPAYYLKCDLANFFVAINKSVLWEMLQARIPSGIWRDLAHLILWHDPRQHYRLRTPAALLDLVPPHKRLTAQPSHLGLPIGNLSSQFFANVYLDALDQRIKHHHRARHYIRYVDDFIILDTSAQRLNDILSDITEWLPAQLGANLNPRKTILQPVHRGIDFVGQVIKPHHRTTRRRTLNVALHLVAQTSPAELPVTINSYFGLLRQATKGHHDRAQLANLARAKGFAVNRALTKAM